jgi:hypothetical protein
MSINAINGNMAGSIQQASVTGMNTTSEAESTQKASVAASQQDTVTLSHAAQAKSLKAQGETPAQIALAMKTDVKTVDGYLGITTTTAPTVTTKPVAAATSQANNSYEEATEPAAEKAAETAAGTK